MVVTETQAVPPVQYVAATATQHDATAFVTIGTVTITPETVTVPAAPVTTEQFEVVECSSET